MAEKVESIIYMIFFYSKEASKGQNNDPTVARERNWTVFLQKWNIWLSE